MSEQSALNYPYLDMHSDNQTRISFEQWKGSRSIGLHCHNFYELVIIHQGACKLLYDSTETILVPGDACLLVPHHAHGYALSNMFTAYNLKFELEALGEQVLDYLSKQSGLFHKTTMQNAPEIDHSKIATVEVSEFMKSVYNFGRFPMNRYKKNITHIDVSLYGYILTLINRGMTQTTNMCDALIRQRCLELILIELQQMLNLHNTLFQTNSQKSIHAIYRILDIIENHIDESLDFNALAKELSFNPNYLRKLFKAFTGLSPVSYINRRRIMMSYENMKYHNMSIKDAATAAGIYDLNYFSRLFKQVIGCSPKEI